MPSAALAAEATQFIHQQIAQYRYWYERLPYTALAGSLPPLQSEIFSIQNVAKDTRRQGLAIVSGFAASPAANLLLQVTGPEKQTNEYTQAFPANLAPIAAGLEDGERSDSKLALTWINNSGAPITNAQANYYGAIKQLTTADRILRGLPLTTEDERLAKKFQLVGQGLHPLSLREMIQQGWLRSVVDEDYLTAVLDVGTTVTAIPPYTPPPGTVLVVHTIAAALPAGSVGNLVQLTIDRDNQDNHLTVLLDNAPGLATPWRPWMTATESLRFSLQAQTATAGVLLRIHWYRVKITGVLSVLIGQSLPEELPPIERDLYDKIRAGVIA